MTAEIREGTWQPTNEWYWCNSLQTDYINNDQKSKADLDCITLYGNEWQRIPGGNWKVPGSRCTSNCQHVKYLETDDNCCTALITGNLDKFNNTKYKLNCDPSKQNINVCKNAGYQERCTNNILVNGYPDSYCSAYLSLGGNIYEESLYSNFKEAFNGENFGKFDKYLSSKDSIKNRIYGEKCFQNNYIDKPLCIKYINSLPDNNPNLSMACDSFGKINLANNNFGPITDKCTSVSDENIISSLKNGFCNNVGSKTFVNKSGFCNTKCIIGNKNNQNECRQGIMNYCINNGGLLNDTDNCENLISKTQTFDETLKKYCNTSKSKGGLIPDNIRNSDGKIDVTKIPDFCKCENDELNNEIKKGIEDPNMQTRYNQYKHNAFCIGAGSSALTDSMLANRPSDSIQICTQKINILENDKTMLNNANFINSCKINNQYSEPINNDTTKESINNDTTKEPINNDINKEEYSYKYIYITAIVLLLIFFIVMAILVYAI